MQMMMYDTTVKRQSTSPITSEQQLKKTVNLATEATRPIYDGAKLAIQNMWNLLVKLGADYIFFPKNLFSGFSCFYCERCQVAESPIPIKDRGIDLTSEGRHHCTASKDRFVPISHFTPAQILKLGADMSNMFIFLNRYIELWIPGKKIIVAKRIDVPNGQGIENDLNYIEKRYDIPSRYHLQEIASLDKVSWLQRLLTYGKIEPTKEELEDFCAYCDGTYAIFQVRTRDSVEYYDVHLAPDELSNSLASNS